MHIDNYRKSLKKLENSILLQIQTHFQEMGLFFDTRALDDCDTSALQLIVQKAHLDGAGIEPVFGEPDDPTPTTFLDQILEKQTEMA